MKKKSVLKTKNKVIKKSPSEADRSWVTENGGQASPSSGQIYFSPYAMFQAIQGDSDTLLICFSHRDMPAGKFSQYRILQEMLYPKLFLNCQDRTWYQAGIPPFGDTIEETAKQIADFCQNRKFRRLICFGYSMGGYAALIYGRLLKADTVLAFSPEVILNFPFSRSVEHLNGTGDPTWTSLVSDPAPQTPSRHLVFTGAGELSDVTQAIIWNDWTDGSVYIVNGTEHSVVPFLHERGLLIPLLQAVIKTGEVPAFDVLQRGLGRFARVFDQSPGAPVTVDVLLDLYKSLCEASPNDHILVFQMGAALRRARRHQEAILYLERAVQLRPRDARYKALVGRQYTTIGEPAKAAIYLEEACFAAPDNVEFRQFYADALGQLGRSDDAANELIRAYVQAQGQEKIAPYLLRMLLLAGRNDEAIELIEAASSMSVATLSRLEEECTKVEFEVPSGLFVSKPALGMPRIPARWQPSKSGGGTRGSTACDMAQNALDYMKKGDIEAARQVLANLDPNRDNYAEVMYAFGKLRYLEGRPEQAEHYLLTTLVQVPTAVNVRRDLCTLYEADQRHSDALIQQLEAIAYSTEASNDWRKLGHKLLRDKRFEEASAALQKAVAAPQPEVSAFHLLGSALARTGMDAEALEAFQAALEREPNRLDALREAGLVCLKQGRPETAIVYLAKALDLDPKQPRAYIELARAEASASQNKVAEMTLRAGLDTNGENFDLLMALARLCARKGDRLFAIDLFARARSLKPDDITASLEYVRQAMSLRRFGLAKEVTDCLIVQHLEHPEVLFEYGRVCLETAQPERARESFLAALERKPDLHQAHYRLAQISLRENGVAAAVGSMDQAIALDPQRVSYRIDRARMHLALNNFSAARADAQAALAVEPKNLKAAQIVSLVREMADEHPIVHIAVAFHAEPADLPALAAAVTAIRAPHEVWVSSPGADAASLPDLRLLPAGRDMVEPALADASDAEWMLVASASAAPAIAARLANPALEAALRPVERIYGRAVFTDAAGLPVLTLLRRELLHFFGDMAAIERRPTHALIEEHEEMLRTVTLGPDGALHRLPAPKLSPTEGCDRVFLISRHGFELYGGGEQFLRGMAGIYRGEGFEPIIIGMRSDNPSAVEGDENGQRFAQIRPLPGDIFAYTLRQRPCLVQILSGLGYEVLTPLKYLHVATVYGTHYWRDMFEEIGGYLNIDQTAVPKREFNTILQHATVVYSNSHYTAEMKRKHFGVSTPLVYSLTADAEVPPVTGGQYALLVNARPEKGFDLILDVAKRVPHIPFLVLASQSPIAQAEEAVARAGVTNITVVGKVSEMMEAYARAKVVLVPSYSFIETFSRVVIEAHRQGLPVVGSNRGNVPYLLTEPGTALPEDADAWAAELDRLFTDPVYYGQRVRLALENSERYAFARQPGRIRRIVNFSRKRILVAVGAGLGNIVQTSPLIRRLSEHYGCPVDVVVKEDFKGCSVLVAGAPWVNMTFPLDRNVVRREYDLVYVTHSFGDIIPSFNSNTVVAARRHFVFQMTKEIHEAEFNLFCAEKLLGVPYEKTDAAKYFVADSSRAAIPNGLIGIHSGGKGGEWEEGSWLNKRWPYYKDLVKALQQCGYKVASFGVGSEYVEGTIDLTGTPLMESVRNIAACSYFIGNDSGLMHIADGLGVPLTTIFGPTSVVKNGPLAPTSSVIELKKSCAPCQFDERFATCTCIASVGLEPVLEHVLCHMGKATGLEGEGAYTALENLPILVA